MLFCLYCEKELQKPNTRYCSNKCQSEFEYRKYIADWKQGKVSGSRGVNAKNVSRYLVRYLRKKYKSCSICGWNEVNLVTGKIPLEIDHIDGDSENNAETNLRLICPNCHSLSSNFRNLNNGKGREWRRLKYIKVDSK